MSNVVCTTLEEEINSFFKTVHHQPNRTSLKAAIKVNGNFCTDFIGLYNSSKDSCLAEIPWVLHNLPHYTPGWWTRKGYWPDPAGSSYEVWLNTSLHIICALKEKNNNPLTPEFYTKINKILWKKDEFYDQVLETKNRKRLLSSCYAFKFSTSSLLVIAGNVTLDS